MNDLIKMPPAQQSGHMETVESARAIQEVQGMLVSAKNFPRDQNQAYTRIMTACKRKTLAETAMYAYPRGGQMVTGPSVRLAEVLAQNWGNIRSGVRELSNKSGESIVQAFCWDMETNVSEIKEFTVTHKRHTKARTYDLKDPRDIYELVANQGARRKRACILAIVPGDIVEAAIAQCEQTLKSSDIPMEQRIRTMVTAFKELGVTQEAIEARLGHNIDVTIPQELVNLQKIFKTIKDGFGKREDFFEITKKEIPASEKAEEVKDKLLKKKDEKK